MWDSGRTPIERKSILQARLVEPKLPFVTALNQFAGATGAHLRAMFDDATGHLRTLTTEEPNTFLWFEPMLEGPARQAQRFLEIGSVRNVLDLQHADISEVKISPVSTLGGYRASFTQEVTATDGRKLRVRNGFVDVVMDEQGRVISLTNELRHGERLLSLNGIIGEQEAIAFAKEHMGWRQCDIERAELVASSYDRESTRSEKVRRTIEPAYEVVISACNPRRSQFVLIKATTGEVVHERPLTHKVRIVVNRRAKGAKARARHVRKGKKCSIAETDALFSQLHVASALSPLFAVAKQDTGVQTTAKTKVKGHAFLCVPDPDKEITKQYYKVILESLTDAGVLANENFRVFVGSRRSPVKAKNSGTDKGTFNYKPYEPEFAAVATMFALNIQWELLKKWGMKLPEGTPAMDVRVEDKSLTDNAQFDQVTIEITIGTGTGVSGGGLTAHIAYDIGVSWHENGHHVVFRVAPGNDLGGVEGEASHEMIGDMETLRMDWWFRSKFANTLGVKITAADIARSLRKVGSYAQPPHGIRQQKNTAKPPVSGEAHDDSLIVGGAMSDVMVDFVQTYGVEKGLETFGKLQIGALAIVPRHKVRFRDLLNALLTADNRLNSGANKQVIVQRFDEHGIKLTGGRGRGGGGSTGGSPVIIIVS